MTCVDLTGLYPRFARLTSYCVSLFLSPYFWIYLFHTLVVTRLHDHVWWLRSWAGKVALIMALLSHFLWKMNRHRLKVQGGKERVVSRISSLVQMSILAFIVMSGLSLLWTDPSMDRLGNYVGFLGVSGITLVMIDLFDNCPRFTRLCNLVILGSGIVAVNVIWIFVSHGIDFAIRPKLSNANGDPNLSAWLMGMAIPVCLLRVCAKVPSRPKISRSLHRMIYLGASLVLLVAILMTGSRSAFLGVIAIAICLALANLRSLLLAITGVGFLIGSLSLLPQRWSFLNVFAKREIAMHDQAFEFRMQSILAGLAMFRENVLAGVGFDQSRYQMHYQEGLAHALHHESFQVHSSWVYVLAELGLLGGVVYIVPLCLFLLVFLRMIGGTMGDKHLKVRVCSVIGLWCFQVTMLLLMPLPYTYPALMPLVIFSCFVRVEWNDSSYRIHT